MQATDKYTPVCFMVAVPWFSSSKHCSRARQLESSTAVSRRKSIEDRRLQELRRKEVSSEEGGIEKCIPGIWQARQAPVAAVSVHARFLPLFLGQEFPLPHGVHGGVRIWPAL